MIHHIVDESGAHWGASTNGLGGVLAQMQDRQGEQVRVILTPEQAEAFAAGLIEAARQARQATK